MSQVPADARHGRAWPTTRETSRQDCPGGTGSPSLLESPPHLYEDIVDQGRRVASRRWWGAQGVRGLVGGVLLAAGGLKGYALTAGVVIDTPLIPSRWMFVALLEFELLLGLWLLSGFRARQARLVALACFTAFLAVSLSQTVAGETSCGCFGPVAVSPWLTALIDLAAVIALWRWRPARTEAGTPRTRPALLTAFAALSLTVISLGAYAAIRSQPASLSEDGDIIGEGRVVVLEPEKWVSKRFPLLKHIDIGPRLAFGRWIVVLYRRDCPRCREELPKYERLAQETAWRGDALRVALVEVPQFGEAGQRTGEDASGCLRGRLSDAREWFVKVPVVLRVQDGRVMACQKQ